MPVREPIGVDARLDFDDGAAVMPDSPRPPNILLIVSGQHRYDCTGYSRDYPVRTCSRWVSHFLDLPPTLLEVIGRPVPSDFHGRSLLPLLRGEPAPGWREAVVATYNGQQFGLCTQRMLRTEEWKYVWNATDIDELYDLKRDPDELHNVIADPAHREKIADFRRRLYHILVREGDGMMKGEWIRDQLLQSRKR